MAEKSPKDGRRGFDTRTIYTPCRKKPCIFNYTVSKVFMKKLRKEEKLWADQEAAPAEAPVGAEAAAAEDVQVAGGVQTKEDVQTSEVSHPSEEAETVSEVHGDIVIIFRIRIIIIIITITVAMGEVDTMDAAVLQWCQR